MNDETFQFAISQYLDGSLPPGEAAALEKRLADDPAARRVAQEYRRLEMLIAHALPAPEMDWDKLAAKIGKAVDGVAMLPNAEVVEKAQSDRMAGLWGWRPMAIAAGLLMAVGLAVVMTRPAPQAAPVPVARLTPVTPGDGAFTPRGTPEPAPIREAMANWPSVSNVQVLIGEGIASDAMVDVNIGPSAAARTMSMAEFHPEIAMDRPASVSIAGSPAPMMAQDDDSNPLR